MAVVLAGAWPAAAQSNGTGIPRTPDGKPDLSGVWWPGQDVAVQTLTIVGTDGGRTAATSAGPRANSFGSRYKPEVMAKAKTLSDRNWILDHADVSFHSTALHEIQRYQRLDADTLEIESTFEDPKVLTGPWTTRRTLKLAPFDKIMETACSGVETAGLMDYAAKENYGRK